MASPNIYQSLNKTQIERLNQLFSYVRENRPLDAIIRQKDSAQTDKFQVDIYESGYGNPPTKKTIDAFTLGMNEAYELNYPCKVIYKDGAAFIRPELYPLYLKPKTPVDTSTNNRIEGWPCDQEGNCDSSINDPAKTIYLNFAFPANEIAGNPDSTNTTAWLWVKYPRSLHVTTPVDYKSAGIVLFGAGIPKPTQRYQVFTPIDDTLLPSWTDLRFPTT
jgi:hypothetical protein